MILNDTYRFVFVHIPKTAGTSVRSVLGGLDGNNTLGVAKTKHETPREFLGQFTERTGQSPEDVRGYRYVCFVRHPVDRFASLHRYLIKTHRHIYPQVPMSFNRFVDVAAERPDWATAISSLRPQVDFVRDVTPWIGRFETLEADFARLCEVLGVDIGLQHLNASIDPAGEKAADAWSLRKLVGRIKRGRRSAKYRSEPCSADSRSKLEALYAEDMDHFRY